MVLVCDLFQEFNDPLQIRIEQPFTITIYENCELPSYYEFIFEQPQDPLGLQNLDSDEYYLTQFVQNGVETNRYYIQVNLEDFIIADEVCAITDCNILVNEEASETIKME